MVLLGKIMILQGVGHQISCLGVCYANDPKKGGYTTPAPALDLTTSLRGDLTLLTLKVEVCNVLGLLWYMFLHVFVCWCTNSLAIALSPGSQLC